MPADPKESVFLIGDSLPGQFALVTFNQSMTRITSAIYMREDDLRVVLLDRGLATTRSTNEFRPPAVIRCRARAIPCQ